MGEAARYVLTQAVEAETGGRGVLGGSSLCERLMNAESRKDAEMCEGVVGNTSEQEERGIEEEDHA